MQNKRKHSRLLLLLASAAVVLGFALLIVAHANQRAYVFLVLGAGGFMEGLAGIIVIGQKVRVVVDYDLIAIGFVTMVVGLNYVIGTYGTEPSLIHGLPVIAAGALASSIGMLREMVVGSNERWFHRFLERYLVRLAGSSGISLGYCWLAVSSCAKFPGHVFLLLALGAVCLIGEMSDVIFVQRRVPRIGR